MLPIRSRPAQSVARHGMSSTLTQLRNPHGMPQLPVIIIGAGIAGLTLANGLKKAGIPFEIFERDEGIDSRGQGWAITLHWALPYLEEMLSPEAFEAFEDTQVDPAIGKKDTGTFLFLNAKTLDPKFRIPPNKRRRVSRDKMRRVLLENVKEHVHWSKRLVGIDTRDVWVTAEFEGGYRAAGSIIVGAEGSNSRTREFLCPDSFRNYELPIRFVGVAMDMTEDQVEPLRNLDPLLFQGSHPDTGSYMWVSMLDVPETNGTMSTGKKRYRVQVNLSWKVLTDGDQVPDTNTERLRQMRRKSEGFHGTLRTVIDSIPEDTPVVVVKLADWLPQPWTNDRVTLIGDAAHAMTMYRGQAANHGIFDAYTLLNELKAAYPDRDAVAKALSGYRDSMRERTTGEVLLSREACVQAHDFNNLNKESAVLRRRA